jgi:hypothetical protein
VLEGAGLVSRRRAGQRRPCQLVAEPLQAAARWLIGYREFWEESYERLDELLAVLQQQPAKKDEDK